MLLFAWDVAVAFGYIGLAYLALLFLLSTHPFWLIALWTYAAIYRFNWHELRATHQ